MKFFLILFFPILCQAEYLIGYGIGSFLGRHQLQLERISENQRHHTFAIFGFTQDENIGDIRQYSGAYLWSFGQKEFESFKWIPLMAGGFATFSDHKRFYFTSPSKYGDPAYYDITNLRMGLRFGSEFTIVRKSGETLRFVLDGSLLEQALLTYFNNTSEFEVFPAFWSLGFSIRTEF